MDTVLLRGLINSGALLMALVFIYTLIRPDSSGPLYKRKQVLAGLLVGFICIAVMLNAVVTSDGIFFDTRSILLSLAALYFGPLAAVIAGLIGAGFRFLQGGSGTAMGIAVIFVSVLTGLLWRMFRSRRPADYSLLELLLFGITVHIGMLLCTPLLPEMEFAGTLSRIALPILLIYPPVTVFLSKILMFENSRIEKSRLAAALAESEEKYRTIVETADEGIWMIDADNLTVFVNGKMGDILGCRAEEMLGQSVFSYMDEVSKLEAIGNLERGRSGKRETLTFRFMHSSRRDVWTRLSSTPLFDKSGRYRGSLAMVTDITAEINTRKEKEDVELQLRRSQKLEAIGTLAGGIAHDFNNLLSVIIGFSELALKAIPEGSPARDKLSNVLIASDRARDLVRQILAFSGSEEKGSRVISLSSVCLESIELLKAILPSSVILEESISDGIFVNADPVQMQQVIMNLAMNANHAMRDRGGKLLIRLSLMRGNGDEDPGFKAEAGEEGWACLAVKDSGTGMTKELMERIFDPFFTTRPRTEGSGLGLSVVHGIVNKFGGEIKVESSKGNGSLFKIILPAFKAPPLSEKSECGGLHTGLEKILFVDDEPLLLLMGTELLQDMGYDVTSFENSVRALEAFSCSPESFDLVITDMTMPVMGGEELASRILKIRPDIPVILCTGYSAGLTRDRAFSIGIREVLEKPVSGAGLSEAIKRVMGSSCE